MDLHRRQATEGFDDILFGEALDFLQGRALHHFREHRSGGNRRGTAKGLEGRGRDVIIADLQVQMQNIPTSGVFRYADGVCSLECADVAWILIVIEDGIVVQVQRCSPWK